MSKVEIAGIVLGVIGILLTIYFGFKARSAKQNQNSGKSSVNIQSGRDTNINDRP